MEKNGKNSVLEKDDQSLKNLAFWKKITKVLLAIGIILCIVLAVYVIISDVGNLDGLPGFLVALIIICIITLLLGGLGGKFINSRQKKIAVRYTPEVLGNVMDRLDAYDHGGSVNTDYIGEKFGFPHYDRIARTGDYVKGVIHGVPVEFSEFELEEERTSTDSDGDTTTEWVNVFSGLILICRHGRDLNGNFTITQYSRFFHALKTESEAFNKAFSIGADDEHDVFYVLTPHFMEDLMNLSRKMGVIFAFRFRQDGTLLIVMKGMDLFEAEEAESTQILKKKIEEDIDKIAYVLEALEIPGEG